MEMCAVEVTRVCERRVCKRFQRFVKNNRAQKNSDWEDYELVNEPIVMLQSKKLERDLWICGD